MRRTDSPHDDHGRPAQRRSGRRWASALASTLTVVAVPLVLVLAHGQASKANPRPAPAVLMGNRSIERKLERRSAGRAQAFRFAAAAGTARWLGIYVDVGNTSRALQLGLYGASHKRPSTLLTSGVIRKPRGGRWAVVHVKAVRLRRGHSYWLAVLSQRGTAAYRVRSGKGCTSYSSKSANLKTAPRHWRSGRRQNTCRLSAIVSSRRVVPSVPAAPKPVAPPTTGNPCSGSPSACQALSTPSIAGTPIVGQVLSVTMASGGAAPANATYQWYDESTAIPGATGSTYTVAASDVDHTIDVAVAGTTSSGATGTLSSASTGVVVQPCSIVVSSNAAIISALQSSANAGKVICAAPGSYDLGQVSISQSAMTTLEAQPGTQPSLNAPTLAPGVNLRFEGFNLTGGFSMVSGTPSGNIKIVGNTFVNCSACGSLFLGQNTASTGNITLAHNLMAGVYQTGDNNDANGFFGCSGWSGLDILYNTFEFMNNEGAIMGDCHNVDVIGNEFFNIVYDKSNAAGGDNYGNHDDCMEIWAGTSDIHLQDNRCEGTDAPLADGYKNWAQDILISGNTSGTMANQLQAGVADECIDANPDGTSNASISNWTITNTTVYNCGNDDNGGGMGGGYGMGMSGPNSTGNVFEYNIFTSWETSGSSSQFSPEDHNDVKNGKLPHQPGTGDVTTAPAFADHHNWQATNLPSNVGYHPARVGYQANFP